MSGIFKRILSNKIFSFFFTLVVIALIVVYGYGTYHSYQHSTLLAFLSGILIAPSFYYAYESYDVEHHPCELAGCDHLATQVYDTYDGRLYICDTCIDHYHRLKGK